MAAGGTLSNLGSPIQAPSRVAPTARTLGSGSGPRSGGRIRPSIAPKVAWGGPLAVSSAAISSGSIPVVERIIAWYRVSSSAAALVALIVANLIPLIGVLFFGWNVWTILIVYWLENGIVGLFNVLKMLYAQGDTDPAGAAGPVRLVNGPSTQGMAKATMIPFFIMHYGIFWFVHGVFVLTLPLFGPITGENDMASGVSFGAVAFAVVALFISHGLSFWWNYIVRGEYRHTTVAGQMFAPYGRLMILHITIIFGALAISFTGAPAAAVAILVGLKIALDVGFHLAEHRGTVPTGAPPPVPPSAPLVQR